jgi:hypothetical protein
MRLKKPMMKGGNSISTLLSKNTNRTPSTLSISFKTIAQCSLIVICALIAFIYIFIFNKNNKNPEEKKSVVSNNNITIDTTTKTTPFDDPYYPPLKKNSDLFAIINTPTRGFDSNFTQIGILTKTKTHDQDPKILPLMGRKIMNGRNKYQYYTISNSGNVNTKLPIRINGRNCMNEYGCDELNNGDDVFVEGYNEKFKTTIYENTILQYNPIL